MRSLDFIGGLVVAILIAIGMYKAIMWALKKNAPVHIHHMDKKDSEE